MTDNDLVIFNNVTLNYSTIENVYLLIQTIRPQWSKFNTIFKKFNDGITNTTIGLFQIDTNTNEINNESEGLIIKIYGPSTDLFINRQNELNIMKELSKYNLSNNILIQFSNGFIYSYIQGETCNSKQLSSKHLSFLIARKLAHYHSLPLPNKKLDTCLISQMKTFISLFETNDQLHKNLLSDIKYIETFIMPKFKLDIVLCHNDLFCGNIIYNSEKDDISFIDFEYSFYNYWLYDIANHFSEYTDYIGEPNLNLYPSREYQKQWLKIYLFYRTKKIENDDFDLDTMCNLIEKFSALAQLFWTLWLFAQAHLTKNVNFDYEKYGHMRYNIYLEFKKFLFED
ncbi:unnamed protein product [Didymodactylos carnosus]|uniref:ethanolamine kinase n=1 Tax=Didymodactylos carnosus TaxID=1234261 RepID=A0A814BGS2_9BILA|nr:unnamed protein product [Didymodactylos carnosus]CAF1148735.1 unnamed protein product [Didymodactylos carnosus]CAF3706462.1 unnamed protein product [Didymodactylos carnosus]CAF3952971.1 unnamed protein product [Didymodactylos carnosus]